MKLPSCLSHDAAVTLLALCGLVIWDWSGLDLTLVRRFGDASGFVLREHWVTSGLLHDGGRVIGWLVFGVLVIGIWRPLPFARSLSRPERVWWVAATLACLLSVSLVKRFSLTSCPWSLAEFGGSARWVSHWAWDVADGGPGHCFPSGHASAALAFISGWFVLRDRHACAARGWLLTVLSAGVLLGGAQLVRGAHYPSHTLWTAWICWLVCALAWHAARIRTAPPDRLLPGA
jgi:membrane-associated PAP2 superfamily phosphatase